MVLTEPLTLDSKFRVNGFANTLVIKKKKKPKKDLKWTATSWHP